MADHGLPKITVAELRAQLDALDRKFDRCEVQVWLPGSYIALCPILMVRAKLANGPILLEGNIIPGSALSDLIESMDDQVASMRRDPR